jgi:hypothetical protein
MLGNRSKWPISHEQGGCYAVYTNMDERDIMKKVMLFSSLALLLACGVAAAREVRDWRDLLQVHEKVQQAIRDMERARAANHYDMEGHGAKAEQLLRDAEHELHEAVEASKHSR